MSKVRKKVFVGILIPPLLVKHLSTFTTPCSLVSPRISSTVECFRPLFRITPLQWLRSLWTLTLTRMPGNISVQFLARRSDVLLFGQSIRKLCFILCIIFASSDDTPLNKLLKIFYSNKRSSLSLITLSRNPV